MSEPTQPIKGPSFPTAPCRGCGKAIVWARGAKGDLPLDPTPPVYKVINSYDNATGKTTIRAERKLQSMVLHFATCKKPEMFSGKNRIVNAERSSPTEADAVTATSDDQQKAFERGIEESY